MVRMTLEYFRIRRKHWTANMQELKGNRALKNLYMKEIMMQMCCKLHLLRLTFCHWKENLTVNISE